MLPFLRPRKQDSGIATVLRAPDEDSKLSREHDDDSGLEAAMEDFCRASDSRDYKAMAEAIKAAFDICDAMPHYEGPHTDESEE